MQLPTARACGACLPTLFVGDPGHAFFGKNIPHYYHSPKFRLWVASIGFTNLLWGIPFFCRNDGLIHFSMGSHCRKKFLLCTTFLECVSKLAVDSEAHHLWKISVKFGACALPIRIRLLLQQKIEVILP